MLLINAKSGANGKAATKMVTKPYWITERKSFQYCKRWKFLRYIHPKISRAWIWLNIGNRSSIVKITPIFKVFPTFSQNFPPVKNSHGETSIPPPPQLHWQGVYNNQVYSIEHLFKFRNKYMYLTICHKSLCKMFDGYLVPNRYCKCDLEAWSSLRLVIYQNELRKFNSVSILNIPWWVGVHSVLVVEGSHTHFQIFVKQPQVRHVCQVVVLFPPGVHFVIRFVLCRLPWFEPYHKFPIINTRI